MHSLIHITNEDEATTTKVTKLDTCRGQDGEINPRLWPRIHFRCCSLSMGQIMHVAGSQVAICIP